MMSCTPLLYTALKRFAGQVHMSCIFAADTVRFHFYLFWNPTGAASSMAPGNFAPALPLADSKRA